MGQLEDIFDTKEFKELPWKRRLWVRVQVAFAAMLEM